MEFKNGVAVDLAISSGEFVGLGVVTAGGIQLRSPRRPLFIEIRNPDGVMLCNYRIREQRPAADGFDIVLDVSSRQDGKMEWQLHECRYRYNTADWTLAPKPLADTTVTLELRPVNRTIGGRSFAGFSYRYRYSSKTVPIYQILDRGTWEIGGQAVGNEVWMRNGTAPSIAPISSDDQHYSTEWYLPTAANPNVFQFNPLQTQLQGFTCTAHEKGILVTWPTEVAHVRTLIEKRRDSREICHWHEHCGDLAYEFSTPTVEVLWLAGSFDFVGRANVWQAMFDHVSAELHGQIGMEQERVTSYAIIEEWGNADLMDYAKRGLPKILNQGIKTIFLANHLSNTMNTFGVGNMCCTVDWKVAESVGEDNLRNFCHQARAGGARVEMWGNTALSTLSVMFDYRDGRQSRIDFPPKETSAMEAIRKAKSPFVRTPANHIECDHYSPVFAVVNLREPAVVEYWNKSWQHLHDSVGIDAIFLDSSFNMSSDKFHYEQNVGQNGGGTIDQLQLLKHERPAQTPPTAILSQYRAHLDLMVQMQRMGYHYCGEDSGVFGTHRAGTSLKNRMASLPMWVEGLAPFDAHLLKDLGFEPDDAFFRGLAYRTMWNIYWDMKSDALSFIQAAPKDDAHRPRQYHFDLLRAFDEVSPWMRNRTILELERGVMYEHEGVRVLWAFEDMEIAGDTWKNVVTGESGNDAPFTARRRGIYILGPMRHQQGKACARI